jgi:hypothetical protein
MTCQELVMRKFLTQKYEEYEPNLNPYSSLLFCEHWVWPTLALSQNAGGKGKGGSAKPPSIKEDILNW